MTSYKTLITKLSGRCTHTNFYCVPYIEETHYTRKYQDLDPYFHTCNLWRDDHSSFNLSNNQIQNFNQEVSQDPPPSKYLFYKRLWTNSYWLKATWNQHTQKLKRLRRTLKHPTRTLKHPTRTLNHPWRILKNILSSYLNSCQVNQMEALVGIR